jgi:hypothetical protein
MHAGCRTAQRAGECQHQQAANHAAPEACALHSQPCDESERHARQLHQRQQEAGLHQ